MKGICNICGRPCRDENETPTEAFSKPDLRLKVKGKMKWCCKECFLALDVIMRFGADSPQVIEVNPIYGEQDGRAAGRVEESKRDSSKDTG